MLMTTELTLGKKQDTWSFEKRMWNRSCKYWREPRRRDQLGRGGSLALPFRSFCCDRFGCRYLVRRAFLARLQLVS